MVSMIPFKPFGRPSSLAGTIASLALLFIGISAPAMTQEFEAGLDRASESCRMDTCSGFSLVSTAPLKSVPNGTLFDVVYKTTYKEYGPSESHPYQRVTKSETGVGNRFVFCSKTRPAIFSFSPQKHLWHLRILFPGDALDVQGADDTDTSLYLAACHHYFPQDWTSPAAITIIRHLGYAFRDGDADKFGLPTAFDNLGPVDFVIDLADKYIPQDAEERAASLPSKAPAIAAPSTPRLQLPPVPMTPHDPSSDGRY